MKTDIGYLFSIECPFLALFNFAFCRAKDEKDKHYDINTLSEESIDDIVPK